MDEKLKKLEEKLNITFNELNNFNDNFEIIVTGDCNDADYNTRKTSLTLDEFKKALPYIKRFFEKNEEFDGTHNVEHFDEFFEDMEDDLSDYIKIPGDDWGWCHTICEIEIYFYSKDDKKIYLVNI